MCVGVAPTAHGDEDTAPSDAAPIDSPAEEMAPVEHDQLVGRLRRNSQRRQGDAPYVLLGRHGRIQTYVQPTGDENFDSYIDQVVRISGQKGSSPGKVRPILEVDDIAPLGQPARQRAPAEEPRANRRPRSAVQQAAYEDSLPMEPIPDGVPESPDYNMQPEFQPWDGYESNGSCDTCGGPGCDSCCGYFCGPPGRVWVRAEYLYWYTKGMQIPPLVTTGPSVDQPGYLGSPGTEILFGDQSVNTAGRSGLRLTAGFWLNAAQTVGIEADYVWLANLATNYSASSNGSPILSRPFFDLSPMQSDPSQIVGQNVETVAAPGILAGSVSVDAQTVFQTGGIRALFNLCCSQGCYPGCLLPGAGGPGGRRVDFLIGYRYARLGDSLAIYENLRSLESENPGSFVVNDSFKTTNIFNGVELGTSSFNYRGRWSLELLMKMALGNTQQQVDIQGYTTTTQSGSTTTDEGGLLAQRTNIGQYSRNQMSIIPQLGANVGYQLTPRLRALLGYTFFYWSNVARAGNQIDFDVNSRLLPNDTRPPAGDMSHPRFVYQTTDFWAQGLNAGLDYRW